MTWRLGVSKKAQKNLDRFPVRDQDRIGIALDQLTQNPYAQAAKRLNPGSTEFSMRVGSYRILFDIISDYRLIAVQSIKRRSSTTYRSR